MYNTSKIRRNAFEVLYIKLSMYCIFRDRRMRPYKCGSEVHAVQAVCVLPRSRMLQWAGVLQRAGTLQQVLKMHRAMYPC